MGIFWNPGTGLLIFKHDGEEHRILNAPASDVRTLIMAALGFDA